MGGNWEDITSDLYAKIKPIKGRVFSQVGYYFISKKKLCNIWLEFDMNEFEYVDPFYGLQKSTAPFNMQISLWDYIEPLNITNIKQLANLQLRCSPKHRIGAFSNSLHFTIPILKFGVLEKGTIDLYFEYSLTNSDSYGYMTGNIDDHLTKKGAIQMKISIEELQILATNLEQALDIAGKLDAEVYKINEVREATDLNWSSPNYKGYYVAYKAENENNF
jgi:hypothetical protein